MPVVLSQRYIADEPSPRYLDVEGVIYHYPRVYFKRVVPDDHFVYYRPLKGSIAPDARTYFGFGRLGVPYVDPADASLRFVDIKGFEIRSPCRCARRRGRNPVPRNRHNSNLPCANSRRTIITGS